MKIRKIAKLSAEKFNELIRKINTDENAYREIFNNFHTLIIYHLIRKFNNITFAEDATQEFFFKKLPQIKFNNDKYIKNPEVYMCFIATRYAIKVFNRDLAKHANNTQINEEIAAADASNDVEDIYYGAKTNIEILLKRHEAENYFEALLLAGIPDRFLNVFKKMDKITIEMYLLQYWEGYNRRQIAEMLGMSYFAVVQRFTRANKIFKENYFLSILILILLDLILTSNNVSQTDPPF
jgi:DNA-directed RNA polymerase specialized sigma24 family protein